MVSLVMADAGWHAGERERRFTDVGHDENRAFGGLTVTPYNIPRNTVASYDPECNVLVPISHHDEMSKTPASKSVPVRVERDLRERPAE